MSLTPNIPSSGRRAGTLRRSKKVHADPTYLSVSQTRALLGESLAERNALLAGEDMLSTDEAATLAGTSRVTVNAWIRMGRCIGLSQTKRGFKVPRWQFEPRIWPVIQKLSAALGTTDGWQLFAFLESPTGALDGLTPRAAIERGNAERVLALAQQEGI